MLPNHFLFFPKVNIQLRKLWEVVWFEPSVNLNCSPEHGGVITSVQHQQFLLTEAAALEEENPLLHRNKETQKNNAQKWAFRSKFNGKSQGRFTQFTTIIAIIYASKRHVTLSCSETLDVLKSKRPSK